MVMAMGTLVRGRFSWDEASVNFPGWYDPKVRWNGFACPFFDLATGKRIAAWNARERRRGGADAGVDRIRYNDRVGFLIDNPEMYPGEPPEVVEGVIVRTAADGTRRLFPIGAWAWTWYNVDDEGQQRSRPRPRRKGRTRSRAPSVRYKHGDRVFVTRPHGGETFAVVTRDSTPDGFVHVIVFDRSGTFRSTVTTELVRPA